MPVSDDNATVLQCEQLAGGVDVLVATPGRLLAHLEKGSLQLDETLAVVLDEIDILAGQCNSRFGLNRHPSA